MGKHLFIYLFRATLCFDLNYIPGMVLYKLMFKETLYDW